MKKKELNKVEQINQSELVKYNKVIQDVQEFEKKIALRINYIIDSICDALQIKCYFWKLFNNTLEIMDNILIVREVLNVQNDIQIIINDGSLSSRTALFYEKDRLLDWSGGFDCDFPFFPKRWLFEPFEQELKEGREKYLKELEQQKLDRKEKEKNDKKLKRQALKKLTNEEKKSLGITEKI